MSTSREDGAAAGRLRLHADTLSELLDAAARTERVLTVIDGQDSERCVPCAQLAERALARLGALQAAGARPGDALILLLEDRLAFLELFWAATLGGLVPVPVAGGISDEHRLKLYRIAERLHDPWLVTDAATSERLERFVTANASAVPGAAALASRTRLIERLGTRDAGTRHDAAPGDVALVQFSSGSTSAPKGVVLTHANLLTNLDGILEGMDMQPQDTMLSWMPLTHDMGLIGFHLTPMAAGIDHLLMPTDVFVRRPGLWLDAASRHRATVLCSPNFGYEHTLKSLKAERVATLDLSQVRLVFNGAEPISAALVDRFNVALEPAGLAPRAMFPVYGLAEASLAVAFPVIGAELQVRHLSRGALGIGDRVSNDRNGAGFVSVGTPIPHVQVRIADAAGTTLADGRVGHLLIRGENVTSGYLGNAGLAGVRDTDAIDAEGWLDTGDVAVVLDGQLYPTGRAKDILFVNGQNLYPHDLEATLQAAGVVAAGRLAIAAAPTDDPGRDRIVAFVQHRGDLDAVRTLRETLARELSARAGVALDLVVPVARIPKTTSGKVQRFLLVQALQAGEYDPALDALGPMQVQDAVADADADAEAMADETDHGALEQRLLSLCRARIEDRSVSVNDNLFELGISSLTLAEIHADIEALWPDALDITDLFDYPSVAEIAGVLESRVAA